MGMWVENVQDALKTRRRNCGRSLSTDCSKLDIDHSAPEWVQRQRLLLELLYHNLCVNLYRPFICFRVSPSTKPPCTSNCTPQTEMCVMKCANHAMALTYMIREVLTSTDILAGWHEAFQWQWNCAVSLAGFALVYPKSLSARGAVAASIQVLDGFGHSVAAAVNAANVMRSLEGALVSLASRGKAKHNYDLSQPRRGAADETHHDLPESSHPGLNQETTQAIYTDSVDIPLMIDAINHFAP